MCLGVLPGTTIASKYQLSELYQIGDAARKGDLSSFNRLLEKHQISFIRIGVYLVFEQVRLLVYRNLFRRVFVLTNHNTRLNLSLFEVCLGSMGVEADLDEIECILANLIVQGKIKGYISHEKRFLVVSKTEPFPSQAVIKRYIASPLS